jgi:serine/threonine protein kinase
MPPQNAFRRNRHFSYGRDRGLFVDGWKKSVRYVNTTFSLIKFESIVIPMSVDRPALPPGTVVRGYQILHPIGYGGFSTVYFAHKGSTNDPVAIKVTVRSNAGGLAQLQRELDAMAFLRHPSIVSLRDYFADDDNFYFVLDYCAGGDLGGYLASASAPLSEAVAATVFLQIVNAVDYCHARGVAHRDLKTPNILITTFPTVKVTDFGLCGIITGDKMGTFCGSPSYAAPECLSSIQYDGPLADVWSLGVILYEMVTGRHPWDVTNFPRMLKQIKAAQFRIPSDLSNGCIDLIKQTMALKPADRIRPSQILNHPWLRLARAKARAPGPVCLPNLPPSSREAFGFTQTVDRWAGNEGLMSPFDRTGKPLFVDGGSPQVMRCQSDVLPKLNIGSLQRIPVARNTPGTGRTPRFGRRGPNDN